MNLVTDKWIRVMISDGSADVVSLDEALARAEDIVTLQGSMPERVAMLSMLAGIAQASIGELKDNSAWKDCRPNIISKSRSYLSKHLTSFDLYGKTPFCQIPIIKNIHNNSYCSIANEMSFERPFGDRHTFFDQNAHQWKPTDIEIANMILPYSMFDLGGLFNKKNTWEKNEIVCSKKAAPLCKKLLMVVEGICLLDTIWYHIFPKDIMGNLIIGKPFWELKLSSQKDFQDYALTYFGQLLPIARSILLSEGTNNIFYGETIPLRCKGDESLWDEVRHPMMIECIQKRGKKNPKVMVSKVDIDSDVEVWRQLGSILAINNDADKLAWAFRHARTRGKLFLYVGGLAASQSEILSPLESVFYLSPECDKKGWVSTYANLFDKTNKICFQLNCSIGEYSNILRLGKTMKKALLSKAKRIYWSRMSCHLETLFRALISIEDQDKWIRICWREVRVAYDTVASMHTEHSCEAYGVGSAKLNRVNSKGG